MWALPASFSAPRSAVRATFFFPARAIALVAAVIEAIRSASDMCVYQSSIVGILENSPMASRYAVTEASVEFRASALLKPLLRAAIVKLAAMRLTSYSKGPGNVSSKSLRSNTRFRSGDA